MGISRKSQCSYLCERAKQEVREGELFLHLEVDGVPIYVLQFSIVPGSVAGLEAGNVFLISRIQGVKGGYDQVRAATKALGDVVPPALLVVVLQGIAKAFAIEGLAGVSATSQFSYTQMCADSFNGAYNDFFIELGTTHSTAKFFTSPLPIEEKPVDYIKNGHKARTRRKRAFRLEIAERVYRTIRDSN
jgi:uncharacterized protein VirK/YbjX